MYYDENINYNDYIKYIQNFDVSLMKMIKQVLPERVDMDSGIEIENTILQRQKIQNVRPTVSLNNPNGVIDYEDSILLNGDMYSLSSSVDCGQKISIEDSSFKFYSPASITHNYSTMNYLMGTAFWKGTQNTKESSYDNSSPVEVSASSQTVLYVKK